MITQCGNRIHEREELRDGSLDTSETQVRNDPLVERLHKSLEATGYFITVPWEVTVHVDCRGHVSIQGNVPSYYLKQRAQFAVMSVEGVHSLRNELIVS